jgi:hypothetical protein
MSEIATPPTDARANSAADTLPATGVTAPDPGPNLAALGTQGSSIWSTLIPVSLITLGVALIIVVGWVTIRKKGRDAARPVSARDRLAKLKAAAESGHPRPAADTAVLASALASDARRLAAELTASIDQKSRELDSLIAAADRRIALLSELEASLARTRAGDPTLANSLAPAARAPAISSTAGPGSGLRSGVGRREFGSPAIVADEPSTADGDAMQDEVVRLSKQGLSSVQIAQKLNQHVGTIELVLALRR